MTTRLTSPHAVTAYVITAYGTHNPPSANGDFSNGDVITKVKAPAPGPAFTNMRPGVPASLRERYDAIEDGQTVGDVLVRQKLAGWRKTRPSVRELIKGGYITLAASDEGDHA